MDIKFWEDLWGLAVRHPGAVSAVISGFGALLVGAVWLAWWLRGFIHKERTLLSADRVAKAQAEAEEIRKQLAEAERKNAQYVAQIRANAPRAELLANAAHTSQTLSQLRIISDSLTVTLGPTHGQFSIVLPERTED
jgi:hypothetical protein